MSDDKLPVLGAENVEFDPVSADVDATAKGRDRILSKLVGISAVCGDAVADELGGIDWASGQ
jgi:hypothetical protein